MVRCPASNPRGFDRDKCFTSTTRGLPSVLTNLDPRGSTCKNRRARKKERKREKALLVSGRRTGGSFAFFEMPSVEKESSNLLSSGRGERDGRESCVLTNILFNDHRYIKATKGS